MSEIFSYISPNDILVVDDYSISENIVHTFTDVSFRIEICPNFLNFHSPIAIVNNKIINISNKQLSFLVYKYIHFVGHQLASQMVSTYTNLKNIDEPIEIIEEHVFQFVDYESINGTSHSYDLMFYLLYIYKKYNLTSKLIVVHSNNKYYNHILKLIKDNYNIEYIYLNTNKNYIFKNYSCVRTYQNILFNEVKQFINDTLITTILDKYQNMEYYTSLIKLKINNTNNINRCNDSFDYTDKYRQYIINNNIYDLNTLDNEEHKIYLLNKATNIIISCTSGYYINICYYIVDYSNKNISVVFHTNNSFDLWMFQVQNNMIRQRMPSHFCAGIIDQVYNSIEFKGRIISNMSMINDIIQQL
jgi:hypothetical protein